MFRFVVIQLSTNELIKFGQILKHRLQWGISYSLSLIFQERIVLLINETKLSWDLSQLAALISTEIGEIPYLVGVSDAFQCLQQAPVFYREAVAVLEFAQPHQNKIISFSDYWEMYLFKKCTDELPADALYPAGLQRLIAYNQKAYVDYLETLQIWLEEGCNDSRTAERLFIARNSFLSRKEKLLQLLESDLSDPNERFRLQFCLRLYCSQEITL